jgi:hypothetical protein
MMNVGGFNLLAWRNTGSDSIPFDNYRWCVGRSVPCLLTRHPVRKGTQRTLPKTWKTEKTLKQSESTERREKWNRFVLLHVFIVLCEERSAFSKNHVTLSHSFSFTLLTKQRWQRDRTKLKLKLSPHPLNRNKLCHQQQQIRTKNLKVLQVLCKVTRTHLNTHTHTLYEEPTTDNWDFVADSQALPRSNLQNEKLFSSSLH